VISYRGHYMAVLRITLYCAQIQDMLLQCLCMRCHISDPEVVKRLYVIEHNYVVQSGNLHDRKPAKWRWISNFQRYHRLPPTRTV